MITETMDFSNTLFEDIDMNDDLTRLIRGGSDQILYIYDDFMNIHSNRSVSSATDIKSLVLTKDGSKIIYGGSNTMIIYHLSTGSSQSIGFITSPVIQISLSED
jgi:hypothetical protein